MEDYDRQATTAGFWDDNERAQKILKEKGQVERTVDDWRALARLRDDVSTLIELADEAADPATAGEAEQQLSLLEEKLRALEVRRILAADEDRLDAIVEIN